MSKKYVLVSDDQVVVSPRAAVEAVSATSVGQAAEIYGVSEQTLRRFLADNGWKPQRVSTWQKQPAGVPEGEDVNPAVGVGQAPVFRGDDA